MEEVSGKTHPLEERLQEVETKCAFMEKEAEEYKEAVQGLHTRLSTLEEKIRRLQGELPEPDLPAP